MQVWNTLRHPSHHWHGKIWFAGKSTLCKYKFSCVKCQMVWAGCSHERLDHYPPAPRAWAKHNYLMLKSGSSLREQESTQKYSMIYIIVSTSLSCNGTTILNVHDFWHHIKCHIEKGYVQNSTNDCQRKEKKR